MALKEIGKMLKPETEAELADIVRGASGPMSISGGGTRGMAAEGTLLSTSGLNGVTLYEPGALTLVARSGTPVADIEAALKGERQRLAFEPMDHRTLLGTTGTPTLGGIIAANVSGPRRIQVGAARDFALGARYVDGCGAIVKNGGRVMKNVTGYDLVKLMCGSWGTLGVLSEVSLKVLPIPETEATLCVPATTPAEAVSIMSRAFGAPYDVSGAGAVNGQVQLRLEGFGDSVSYRANALRAHLKCDAEIVQDSASRTLWTALRDAESFQACSAVWKVSLKPSSTPEFLDLLDQRHGYSSMLDWAGGLVWIGVTSDQLADAASFGDANQDRNTDEGVRVLHANLQQNCALLGGHATLVKAPLTALAGLVRFQPEAPAVAALSAGIRARFDPRGILNSGLMTGPPEEVV